MIKLRKINSVKFILNKQNIFIDLFLPMPFHTDNHVLLLSVMLRQQAKDIHSFIIPHYKHPFSHLTVISLLS